MKITMIVAVAALLMPSIMRGEDKLTPKDTPASQSLAKLAREQMDNQAQLNLKLQQARAAFDSSQKGIADSLQKDQKELQDELGKDKHYKGLVDRINLEQKQLQDLSNNAQQKLDSDSKPLQQKFQINLAQIAALLVVVRKENGWPDSVVVDGKTGQFVDSGKK